LAIKKIDCFQCVAGELAIVLRKTSWQSFVSKEPINALKILALTTEISKLLVKPLLSKGF
jgi:hypothetical protein